MMQLYFSSSGISHLSSHSINNPVNGRNSFFSKRPVDIEGNGLREFLLNYFTSPFKNRNDSYSFWHESSLELNTVMHYVDEIFNNESKFHEYSVGIAKQLESVTDSPNIKDGELHLAYLKNLILDDSVFDAISIIKSESKESFFKTDRYKDGVRFELDHGNSGDKIDKGCLILNIGKENGYKVIVIDETNRGGDARYWVDKFLKLRPASDSYNFTKNYMAIAKEFITENIALEYEISNTEKVEFLNRSLEFFNSNRDFSEKQFLEQTFQDGDLIRSFKKFKNEYLKESDVELQPTFTISTPAVKRQARSFKSVLKLDKNFHVYIHGSTELIEKGYDAKAGKNYYKIYFDEES